MATSSSLMELKATCRNLCDNILCAQIDIGCIDTRNNCKTNCDKQYDPQIKAAQLAEQAKPPQSSGSTSTPKKPLSAGQKFFVGTLIVLAIAGIVILIRRMRNKKVATT